MAAISTIALLLFLATLNIANCQSSGPKILSKLQYVPESPPQVESTADQTAIILESNSKLMTTMIDLLQKHDQLIATQNTLLQGLLKQQETQNQIMDDVVQVLQKHDEGLGDMKLRVDNIMSNSLKQEQRGESKISSNMASSQPTERTSTKTETPPRKSGTVEEPTSLFFSKDCDEIWNQGYTKNGIFRIEPEPTCTSKSFFKVSCDLETSCGGWIVIQRKLDASVTFARNWTDYQHGFGNMTGSHWLGLEKLHRLTKDGNWKLRVELEDYAGNTSYAEYLNFAIGDSSTYYQLSFGSYEGIAGDSLMYGKDVNKNMPFSTRDNDHDGIQGQNCAVKYNSGWWFNSCGEYSNLNGPYLGKLRHTYDAMLWYAWKGDEALQKSEMKIKRM